MTAITAGLILTLNLLFFIAKVSTKPGLFKLINKVIGKQVVFMADASLSKTSKWPVVQQEMIKEISKILHLKDATMEFALVAYYSWKELKCVNP